jgi:ABC-type uncharacterized transport system substrate-binding protein
MPWSGLFFGEKMKWEIVPLLLVAVVLLHGHLAEAQQPTKILRIGYVSGIGVPSAPGSQVEAFRRGLRELGYVEGKNFVAEYRYIEGKLDRIPTIVAELVQLKVDVIVSSNFAVITAAKDATKTIPIVMIIAQDPVETRLIDSLARPGGNITGLTRLTRELGGKRLELVREVVPKISLVGVLWDADDAGTAVGFKEYQAGAQALKIQLQSLEMRNPNPDVNAVFRAAANGRVRALVAITSTLLSRHQEQIVKLAVENRLPSMFERNDYVEAGGLMSYSADDADSFRRAAIYVDKILKGAKPADLPVEQPTKFEFVINLKTAKQIGLAIPPNVLARADKVIR